MSIAAATVGSAEVELEESFEVLCKKLRKANHDRYIFCDNLFDWFFFFYS